MSTPPAQRKDRTANLPPFEELYATWFDYVWRSARRLGVDEAGVDDVVQEVFVVVHRRRDAFDGTSSFKTWLYGILLYTVRRYRRTKSRRREAIPRVEDLPLAASPDDSPLEHLGRAEAVALLYRTLDVLPDDKREALVLAELEGMTAPQIAAATGTKLNTVYSRLRGARLLFKRALNWTSAASPRARPPEGEAG